LSRYDGLHDKGELAECIKHGLQSKKFSCLVAWLTSELASYCSIDDLVSAMAGNQFWAILLNIVAFKKILFRYYPILV